MENNTAEYEVTTHKEQAVAKETAAVEKKEEVEKAAAQAEKIASYLHGDLKSFCKLADESIDKKHKTFTKYPDVLDNFVKARREQQLQYTHGSVATIFRFFLSIFSFFFGGKSLNIMPKPLPEKENGFVFKMKPSEAKLLKTQKEIEYEVDGHKIELSKTNIADAKEDGTVVFSEIVVDGTQYKFSDLQIELSKKYGSEKSAEIITSLADFALLAITPEHERSARVGIVQKQHEGVLKKMEKSQSDIAAEKVFARYQAASEEEEPRARSEFVSEAEKKRLLQKLEKNQEDAKTYRPSPVAARSNHDDDNAPRPGA